MLLEILSVCSVHVLAYCIAFSPQKKKKNFIKQITCMAKSRLCEIIPVRGIKPRATAQRDNMKGGNVSRYTILEVENTVLVIIICSCV